MFHAGYSMEMREFHVTEIGVACSSQKDDDDKSVDPDVAFAYIDEKIKRVLGHFQTDFKGADFAENLKAKYGDYGSFLPTYEHCPSIRASEKIPQTDFRVPRSPKNLPIEAILHTLKPPLNKHQSSSQQTVNVSLKQDLCLQSSTSDKKATMKNKESETTGNPSEKKSLKVRIKVGSAIVARNVFYSNRRLELSGDIDDGESPTRIIQVMTAFPVSRGVLLSPLHHNLLCLREEVLYRDWEYDDSIAALGNGLEERKENLTRDREKTLKLKHRDETFSSNAVKCLMSKEKNLANAKSVDFMNQKSLLVRKISKASAVLTKETAEFNEGAALKGVADTASRSEPNKINIQKNMNDVKVRCQDFLDAKLKQTGLLERHACFDMSNRRIDGTKLESRPVSIRDRPKIRSHLTDSEHASDALQQPLISDIEEWVQCEKCEKWRLLPFASMVKQLPKKWICNMLDWLDAGMNRCDISEDDTTQAVHTLYPLPFPVSQTSLENHDNENGNELPSANSEHLLRTSNFEKDHLQVPVKSMTLNRDQSHIESNLVKKSSNHRLNQSPHLVSKKRMAKVNDDHTNGGNALRVPIPSDSLSLGSDERINMKKKREADQSGRGITHKMRMEDACHVDERDNGAYQQGVIPSKKKKLNEWQDNCNKSSILKTEVKEFCSNKKSEATQNLTMIDQKSINGKRKVACEKILDLRREKVLVEEATSSSKVSDCGKTRAKFEEIKCSPVGSVSSSPLRVLQARLVVKRDNIDRGSEKQLGSKQNNDSYKILDKRLDSKAESCCSLGHSIAEFEGVRDSNAANNVLNKAKDRRDRADRLKSLGFASESNEAYFLAALEILHAAFVLEPCNGENGRRGEMNLMEVYSTAAKLCETSGLEYERRQEMAFAALAYKCMEVAYMRIVYCKHFSMTTEQNELQKTLQMTRQGESPSSSASDLDNLISQPTSDKLVLPKGEVSVIFSHNRPTFVRLLDYTGDVNCAMKATRKYQNAFTIATTNLEAELNRETIASLKRVIDFSFQDVEGLLRLVQHARAAVNCAGFGGLKD